MEANNTQRERTEANSELKHKPNFFLRGTVYTVAQHEAKRCAATITG